MPIGKIEQFDLSSKKWSAYIRRVEQFMTLNEIKPELQVATLVTLVGEATYDLMCDLCAPTNPEEKSFRELVKVVSDHLEPRRSDIAERHVFRQRRQKPGECLSEYLQSLKHLASTCNFQSKLEENLRDQFVSGLSSDDMRSRLFAEPTLTYQRAVELALALEAAERHAQASVSGVGGGHDGRPAAEPLHRVVAVTARQGHSVAADSRSEGPSAAGKRASYDTRACWRCGRNHRSDMCRFKNYSCDSCGQKGHLRAMCKQQTGNRSFDKRREHFYIGEEDGESDSDFYNLSVCGKDDKPYFVQVSVNGTPLQFELDTGSKLSTINFDCYKTYFSTVKLLPNDICLRSYTGVLIEPVGYILVDVVLGNHAARRLKLFIIKKGGPPLLGRSWLRQLKIDVVTINDLLLHHSDNNLVDRLKDEFPSVFASGLGTCNKKMSLRLTDSNPVFIKARTLPLALRRPVELELERLVAEGIIYKVDHSDYGTPIVPVIKKSGEIRICGDYKITINPKLVREPYPLPRIEELFAVLSGGEQFSKIDLTNAYQQLYLEDASQACTAITTHVGTFVYRRTPFGLTCIPEKFQKFMEETLRGLRGVAVFLDDIAVTGKNRREHIDNLRALLERLREVGLRIRLEKCSFMRDSISYVGFIIDKQGLHPDPNKVTAIVNAPAPCNVTQLRSFLGMVNYYSKFINNLSSTLNPLYKLLRKNVSWFWSDECNRAFCKIKNTMLSKQVLVHYDPTLPLVLSVDSSSYGIGSVLSHRYPDGAERPICFASRTLNAAERSYSQLDKEALAIFSGVIKHHQYLYGRKFIIKTDHKPLTFIFGPKLGLPQTAASRLQRYATKLAAYDFEIDFVKSSHNGNVDALSRLPLPYEKKCDAKMASVSYINYVEDAFPVSAQDVASATQKDTVLKNIYNYVINGWPRTTESVNESPYFNRKESISLDRGCLLYNHRVIIPEPLRRQVLRELHEGHLGVVKMKNTARSFVYWPQIDADIESLCRECTACCQQRSEPPRSVPHPWAFPARPWQRIHIDFAEFQGKHYLVTVDAHSKWIEVQKMGTTTATATILKLREQFARFGLPTQLVSDGGPPFASNEFADFTSKNLIVHTITSPHRPAGNGAAENAVKSVKRSMKKAVHEGVDVDTAITKFLFRYRNSEHATTGVCPAEAMLGRRLRSRLDAVRPSSLRAVEEAQEREGARCGGTERNVAVGQAVMARDYRPRTDKWAPATVVARDTPVTYRVRLADGGQEWKRHIDQLLAPRNPSMRFSLSQPQAPADLNNERPDTTDVTDDAESRVSDEPRGSKSKEYFTCSEKAPKSPLQQLEQDQIETVDLCTRPKRDCRKKKICYKEL